MRLRKVIPRIVSASKRPCVAVLCGDDEVMVRPSLAFPCRKPKPHIISSRVRSAQIECGETTERIMLLLLLLLRLMRQFLDRRRRCRGRLQHFADLLMPFV